MCFAQNISVFSPVNYHSHLHSCSAPIYSYTDGNYPDDHVCECSSCKCLVITKNKFCVNVSLLVPNRYRKS
ncbi:hypothetical protein I314_00919 [Cryptococcus bacillisporus CA1873]|uniref:Uncharacterized protein n=2 Tax=Cryptococcus gattii TaxID=552467 RepID=A0A0D0VS51_CRYGA|nr:hypothetical protein I312_01000 [Cryptococcus bacillisporus CA1280]KIR68500.1 hypothetical protein I314_00919 [Cryptococcus bacillisporus CA1873]|eukprot:KIR68500.1 hypothetical protein I314_00919 [Cryptococcus gattii CA1873]